MSNTSTQTIHTSRGAKQVGGTLLGQVLQFFQAHKQALFLSYESIKQAPFSSLITILSISIILAIPLGGYVLSNNLNQLQTHVHKTNELTAFLKTDVSDHDTKSLIQHLASVHEIAHIHYQSPTQALAEFKRRSDLNDLISLLPENPLPGVLTITPRTQYQQSENLESLRTLLSQNSSIDHVILDLDWVEKIETISSAVQRFVQLTTLLIGIGLVVLLSNTIRLSLERHRDEWIILSLIGATQRFIRRPFIYRALSYGLLGSLTACIIVIISMNQIQNSISHLASLYGSSYFLTPPSVEALFTFIITSLVLSWFSARLALAQYNQD